MTPSPASAMSQPVERHGQRTGGGHSNKTREEPEARRRTIGEGHVLHAGSTPSKSKTRVSLGSVAASAYYFSGLPKTPLSVALSSKKARRTMSPHTERLDDVTDDSPVVEMEQTGEIGTSVDSSVLSMGTNSSSSAGSDALNRSVLSDTTELTASNFVLTAASKQRLYELSRANDSVPVGQYPQDEESGGFKTINKENPPEQENTKDSSLPTSRGKVSKGIGEEDRSPLRALRSPNAQSSLKNSRPGTPVTEGNSNRSTPSNDMAEKHASNDIVAHNAPAPSPSIRSLVNGSPASARKVAESLRKARLAREQRKISQLSTKDPVLGINSSPIPRRSSIGTVRESVSVSHQRNRRASVGSVAISLNPTEPTPQETPERNSSHAVTTNSQSLSDSKLSESVDDMDVSKGSLNELFEGLVDPVEKNTSPETMSPREIQESSNGSQSGPQPELESSIVELSPPSHVSNPVDEGNLFRLTPNSHKKLTPTKLSPSPRRIANAASIDSPARNTRSAQRAMMSPIGKVSSEVSGPLPSSPSGDTVSPLFEKFADSPARNTRSSSKRKVKSRLSLDHSSLHPDVNAQDESVNDSTELDTSSVVSDKRESYTADPEMLKEIIGGSQLSLSSAAPDKKRRLNNKHSPKKDTIGASPSDSALFEKGVSSVRQSRRRLSAKRRRSSLSEAPLPEDETTVNGISVTVETAYLNDLLSIKGDPQSHKPAEHGVGSTPKSILNSALKRKGNQDTGDKNTHRNSLPTKIVVFRSPEAAEYNLESPSVHLTPMPSSQAKALFVMPNTQGGAEPEANHQPSPDSSDNSSLLDGEKTDEIEENVSTLLDMTYGDADGHTSTMDDSDVSAAANFSGLETGGAQEEFGTSFPSREDNDTDSLASSLAKVAARVVNDESCALEMNLSGLLAKAYSSPAGSRSLSAADDSMEDDIVVEPMSPAETVEMSDAESLVRSILPTNEHSGLLDRSQDLFNETTSPPPALENSTPDATEKGFPMWQPVATQDVADQVDEKSSPSQVPLVELKEENGDTAHSLSKGEPNSYNLKKDTNQIGIERGAIVDTSSVKGAKSETPSRRSFSLVPERKLSLSTYIGSPSSMLSTDNEPQHESKDARSSHGEDTGEANGREHTRTKIDITCSEINHLAELLSGNNGVNAYTESESLLSVGEFAREFSRPQVADPTNEFLVAACREVEGRTESSGDGKNHWSTLVETNPVEAFELQETLRSNDDESMAVKEQLKSLSREVHAYVQCEWKQWETQVVDFLKNTIGNLSDDLNKEGRTIERCTTLINGTDEIVALMSGRAVKKARRRSLKRRKTAASMLEDEIHEMQAQITLSRKELDTVKSEASSSLDTNDALLRLNNLLDIFPTTQAAAELSQGQYISLDRLNHWTPLAIRKSGASFSFNGCMPKTSAIVSYSWSEFDQVTCGVRLDPVGWEKKRSGYHRSVNHNSSINSFLSVHMDSILESLTGRTLKFPSDIGPSLQRLGWVLGRLEMTANELSTLQDHYATSLSVGPTSSAVQFLFSVEYKSKKHSTKLKATFSLVDSYPFTPLDVSLEVLGGSLDIDALRRQLTKNAKPGFGCLSRACDVIAAYVS